MDYLKQFFTDIQERYRNPLISSFIIAWVLFNWRITTLFIHFFTDSNSKIDYDLFVKNIEILNNWIHGFWLPLGSAFFYVLLFPFIRIGISYLQAIFSRWRTDAELKGSKEGSISINKYLSLRDEYKSKIETLREVISSEDTYRIEVNQLTQKLAEVNGKENTAVQNYLTLREKYNFYKLRGFWDLSMENGGRASNQFALNSNGHIINFNLDKVAFEGSSISFYEKSTENVRFEGFILQYEYDKEKEKLSNEDPTILMTCELVDKFEKDKLRSKKKILFFFKLTQKKDFTHLIGTLNEDILVNFRKSNKDQSNS